MQRTKYIRQVGVAVVILSNTFMELTEPPSWAIIEEMYVSSELLDKSLEYYVEYSITKILNSCSSTSDWVRAPCKNACTCTIEVVKHLRVFKATK